jgi:hypothetical protein
VYLSNDKLGGGSPYYQPSPNQPHHSLPTSDELQLTAQLSRQLAPNMNTGNGGNERDGQVRIPGNHQQQHGLSSPHYQMQSPQTSMAQMGGTFEATDENGLPRKRTKVSRACDECRRKKVKCDASDDPREGVVCSNCKRSGQPCSFKREPQKRGPSKGYVVMEIPLLLQSLTNHIQLY